MISEAMFKCYVCCIVCCTVTYGATYISTSKSVIEEGDTFEINCTVIPLTSAVRFLLNGIQRGACSAPVPGIAAGTCPLDITQDINTEETIFTIAPATTVNHTGTWECTHNAESADMTIEVFNFITVLKNNQHELPATIEASSIQNYEFKVYVACGYPQPTIIWTLHKCDGSDTGITVSSSPTLTINTTAGCTLPLVAYTSTIKASALAFPKLETCYIPKATMTYTEKLSVMPSSTFTSEVQVPGFVGRVIAKLQWLKWKILKICYEIIDFLSRIYFKFAKVIGDLKWNMVAGANGFQVISIMVSIILLIIEVCNEDDPSSIAHLIMLILAPFVGVIMLYIFNRTKTSCQDVSKAKVNSTINVSIAEETKKPEDSKEEVNSKTHSYLQFAVVLLPIAFLMFLVILIWTTLKRCINSTENCCREKKGKHPAQIPLKDIHENPNPNVIAQESV